MDHKTRNLPGPPSSEAPTLRDRMLAGGFWVAASQVAAQILQFLVTVALARLLFPSDFGLLGMCAVVTGLSFVFSELGLWSAVVQAKDLKRPAEVSVFWLCLFLGVVVYAGVFLGAGVVGQFYKEPRVVPLLRVLAITIPLNAAPIVPSALLARRLDFKRQGFCDVTRTFGYAVVALPCAIAGAGVWSLVLGEVGGAAARAAALFLLGRWRTAWQFKIASLKRLFRFGLNVTGAGFSLAARDNVDRFIIGRVLGAATLGGYSLALRLITAPQKRISMMLERVTFAGFSEIQDDRERIRAIYCRVVKLTALITFPALAWLAAAARPFVAVVFGDKWLFIVTPIQILCLAGAFYSISTPVRSVILGTGRAAWEFALLFFSFLLVALTIGVGVRFGFFGVAVAFSAQAIISYLIYVGFGHRIITLRPGRFLKVLAVPLAVALAVGITTAAAVAAASRIWGVTITFVCAFVAGGAVYLAALKVARVSEVKVVTSF